MPPDGTLSAVTERGPQRLHQRVRPLHHHEVAGVLVVEGCAVGPGKPAPLGQRPTPQIGEDGSLAAAAAPGPVGRRPIQSVPGVDAVAAGKHRQGHQADEEDQ